MLRSVPLVCLLLGCSLREAPAPATPVCGNALVERGERCDDGNTSDDDGCSCRCALTYCGDCLVQPGRLRRRERSGYGRLLERLPFGSMR